jgi:hypothetical protein
MAENDPLPIAVIRYVRLDDGSAATASIGACPSASYGLPGPVIHERLFSVAHALDGMCFGLRASPLDYSPPLLTFTAAELNVIRPKPAQNLEALA